MGTAKHRYRVEIGDTTKNAAKRVALAQNVKAASATSTLYQTWPDLKDAVDAFVASTQTVKSADDSVSKYEMLLATARVHRDAVISDNDAARAVAISMVEKYAVSREDVQGTGFPVLDRDKHATLPPLSVDARYNAAKNLVRIDVEQAPGMENALTEYSGDAAEPRRWTRLPGIGLKQKIHDLPPGTYWVRAASVRANEESAFTVPVSVTVPAL